MTAKESTGAPPTISGREGSKGCQNKTTKIARRTWEPFAYKTRIRWFPKPSGDRDCAAELVQDVFVQERGAAAPTPLIEAHGTEIRTWLWNMR